MKRLTLIDGSGFIFRAYHSLPPLTRSDGTPTGAVYGFINMILKLLETMKTDSMAVIFDAGRTTFRNRLYSEYKAHRPPPPDDLIPQFPLVREATKALGLPCIEMEDYEADDLIATYTKLARAQGMEVVIVSSDKDLMQLIEDGVSMYDGMKNKIIGREQVIEKFGVGPERVRDVLALIGDSSDNIPGVPGIGPKTAAELITQFGDFEGLYQRVSEIKQPKRRDVILAHEQNARLSHKLIELCETVPLEHSLEALVLRDFDAAALISFLWTMGFKSLATKLEAKHSVKAETFASVTAPTVLSVAQYDKVTDADTLRDWVLKARTEGQVAFNIQTTSPNAMQAELVGVSLAVKQGHACYVPLRHTEAGLEIGDRGFEENKKRAIVTDMDDLFSNPQSPIPTGPPLLPGQIPLKEAFDLLGPLLADPAVLKIGYDVKYAILVLRKYGLEFSPYDDTMLLSYVLDTGRGTHNRDDLSKKHLNHTPMFYDQVTGTGKSRVSFAEAEMEKALTYAAEDADIIPQLWQALKPQLIAQQRLRIYETVERPLVAVLAAMEERGIRIDPRSLSALSADFGSRIAVLSEEIYRLAGRPFTIGSPKQLGEVLFDEMGIAGGKKSSKSGSYSTGADVLEELAGNGNLLAARVLDWRQLSKLKSTYTDALAEEIHPVTGRVHTRYAMAATSTGRLSSSEPNLQNIPIRSEEGRKIRHAFVAAPGFKLVSADYSQIELRLLAHIADIPVLKQAFRNGDDIHAITASQMFGVGLPEVNADLRRKAKTINFGIIYGISAHGLATRLGISRGEAAAYIELYFKQYPGIVEYMSRTKQYAREHGYVTTLFGRVCHVPAINDKNPTMRAFSERAAINAPLQGTAADIIKRAMIRVEKALTGSGARMLLQVHDELVVEVPEGNAENLSARIKKTMEGAANLSLPLTVDTFIGNNWHEAH